MTNLNRRLSLTVLVTTFIAITHAFNCSSVAALPEDKQQPVSISSDRALRDDKQNITVYEGNVEFVQGTLKIIADKITIYNYNKGIGKVIAIGQPAHYQQQPDIGKEDVIAKANTIEFEFERGYILLRGNASIYQNGATLMGEKIDYDIQAAIMKAASDQRIQMLIPPNSQ